MGWYSISGENPATEAEKCRKYFTSKSESVMQMYCACQSRVDSNAMMIQQSTWSWNWSHWSFYLFKVSQSRLMQVPYAYSYEHIKVLQNFFILVFLYFSLCHDITVLSKVIRIYECYQWDNGSKWFVKICKWLLSNIRPNTS